ncbi:hypothetical protein [Rhizobium sp. 2MFCol3.1]|uniref:hypothetical protein n=1 Tax=Rhizobium sp. 2MFCol3.1 TaxID=1246459 RepID=UPI000367942A|nr:hypothetical protein [Rhizobium sp. 2MFCol3.1]
MAINHEKTQELLAAFREDIPFFAKTIFNSDLRPKQVEFCKAFQNSRRISFKGGVGFGKTHVMAIVVWWSLFCHNNVQVTIFGPSESQIKGSIWKEIGILFGRMNEAFKDRFEYSATKLTRKDTPSAAFAEFRLANKDNIETARGIHMHNNFVLVDEATGVPDEIFQVLGNIFPDPNPKLCLISNPSRTSGFFFDTWEHPDISELWTRVHGRMADNPDLSPEAAKEMEIMYGGKGSRDYRIHVEGEFPLEEVDGVIPRDLVIRAIENIDAISPFDAIVVWGLDPNGGGKDRSVLCKRRDNVVEDIKDFSNLDAVQLAQAIHDEYRATPQKLRPVEICVDANGPGYGVYTMLLNMGLPVKKVMVQNSPTRDPQVYSRLRDQLWWECRKWFEDGNVSIPNHPDLISELTFPTYEYEATGKIKVEDKKSIRKRGRKSPDFADALCLTFASNTKQHTGKWAWSKPIEYDVRHYQ